MIIPVYEMEPKKLIVGAWKAYLRPADAKELAVKIAKWVGSDPKSYELALCPSYPLIPIVLDAIRDTEIQTSSQNADAIDYGAHTGHIPPRLLSDMGCKYTLLGHSEMRAVESLESIQKKLSVILAISSLEVILCIGETMEERTSGKTTQILTEQLESALAGLSKDQISGRLNVAYEPVWAISTESPVNPPGIDQVADAHTTIRGILSAKFGKTADTVRVLYGGSVNKDNVTAYVGDKSVDGVLVGSASTKFDEFIGLLDAVERSTSA